MALAVIAAEIRGFGRRAADVQADGTRPTSAEALLTAALAEFRSVDILVNCARDD